MSACPHEGTIAFCRKKKSSGRQIDGSRSAPTSAESCGATPVGAAAAAARRSERAAAATRTSVGHDDVSRKMAAGDASDAPMPIALPSSPPIAREPQQSDCSAFSPSVPVVSPSVAAAGAAEGAASPPAAWSRAASPQRSATIASTTTSDSAVERLERTSSTVSAVRPVAPTHAESARPAHATTPKRAPSTR
eukprot:2261887-Prymnesium_polylepis.1